jgi:hypothetical protein
MKTTIDMAREVKMPYDFVTGEPINIKKLKAFEELVRADEREACAKACEENADDFSEGDWDSACMNCAAAIRNRGQA